MPDSLSNRYFHLEGHVAVPSKSIAEHLLWEIGATHEQRIVAKDHIEGVEVSTVFLSQNHNFREGPPLVFETMVFGEGVDDYQRRYSTWEEAEQGHKETVAKVLSTLGLPSKPAPLPPSPPPDASLKTRLERIDEDD